MTTTTKIKITGPAAGVVEGENAPDPLVRAGVYLVMVAAIVASGDTLIFLASQSGWTDWRAWLLPLLIDVPAFLGGRIWLRRRPTNPRTRTYARNLTLAGLAASLAGNVTGHLVHAGAMPAGLALVIVAAMVAPITLAAVLHLDALLAPDADREPPRQIVGPSRPETRADQDQVPPQLTDQAPPAVESAPASVDPVTVPAVVKPRRKQAKKSDPRKDRAWKFWQTERAEGRTPSGAELGRRFDADDSTGRGWAREFKKTDETTETPAGAAEVPGMAVVPAEADRPAGMEREEAA
ncbi:hypothetical protein [Microlunatus sp. GCM10028923]|uniref:hypothetical protein n=1 Tax=Microlunatus sp. GCM10028923 TaxID=3273400 RepID=UPI003618634A